MRVCNCFLGISSSYEGCWECSRVDVHTPCERLCSYLHAPLQRVTTVYATGQRPAGFSPVPLNGMLQRRRAEARCRTHARGKASLEVTGVFCCEQVNRRSDIYVFSSSSHHAVVPKDKWLAFVSTTVETSTPEAELAPGQLLALHRLNQRCHTTRHWLR